MAVFRFRLESLLDKKVEERDQAAAKLSETRRAHLIEQQKLKEMEKREQTIAQQIAGTRQQLLIGPHTSSIQLIRIVEYLRGLWQDENSARHASDLQRHVVEDAESEVQKAQTWLTECSRDVEVLQKYREKLEESFVRASLRKEEIDRDETSVIMHLKQSGGL